MSKSPSPVEELSEKDKARFWAKVNKDGPVVREELGNCWLWTASKHPFGYGQFGMRENGRHTVRRTHRIAFEMAGGVIPSGGCVLHKCDQPSCVRAGHLYLGTRAYNADDRVRRGRSAIGDAHSSRTHPERVPRGDANGVRTHPERIPRGEKRPFAKLTEENVRMIRARYATGSASQKQLADELGVARSRISKVVTRRVWRHIA